jgi:type IV secretory pathway VirB4 component
MRKTLAAANRGERVPFKIPRSVQQSIPIQRVWQDGIWQVNGKYSQTWRFADINYSLASYEDQRDMFTSYCGVLNSLPTDAVTKITIHNRRLNSSDFQHSVLMRECGDDLDLYRREYNRVLTEKAAASNNLIQDKYITVSVARKNAEEARAFFHRVDADLSKNLGRLDSGAKALDTYERLRILHDFFRPGEEQFYKFDLNASMRLGHSFKDYIAPDGMKFLSDHFELGGKVGRVLFMRKYSSYIKDDMITSMADFPRTLVLSIDLLPVPTDEAVRDVQSQIMGIESDITRWQQRQNARNNFTAVVPYELEQQRAETKEFLDDLSTRDQRMVYANVTLLHMADTLEQLNADTETLLSKSLCDFSILRYQQEDGFNTALPYGLRSIDVTRTLTTEAAASLMPFRVQEIQDMGGIYCGVNAVSKNLLICNRKNLLNPHGFILGVSGSGKSFTMKEFITFIALSTNDDIIIIDAEREYGDLVRALRGIVLEISPNSRHHINPLEIARGYGMGENPVALKSELLMSICEQQMGEGQLGAFHKSIIDRCTASVYHDFIKSGGKARQPILSDWRNEIKRQPEREAQELALASELFVEGSLNMFAHETNVDIDNRIIVFDLYEMGDQLKPTALNVTMETIQNRVATNRLAGKYTWVFVDEVYLFFKYYYSAQFLYKAWKRFRKYGAALTAATQNVEECLRSETARLMFANSEFLVLLNQAATDRAELAKLLNISENQMGYVTNVEAGHGLLRVGGAIVPFANEFPRTGALYQLWNTTPTDK